MVPVRPNPNTNRGICGNVNKKRCSGAAHSRTHDPAIASRLASHAVHLQNWHLLDGTSRSRTQTSRPILCPPPAVKRPDGYIAPQTRYSRGLLGSRLYVGNSHWL
jgi:hypothetical protein